MSLDFARDAQPLLGYFFVRNHVRHPLQQVLGHSSDSVQEGRQLVLIFGWFQPLKLRRGFQEVGKGIVQKWFGGQVVRLPARVDNLSLGRHQRQ